MKGFLFAAIAALTIFAAPTPNIAPQPQTSYEQNQIQVEITSPTYLEGKPIFDTDVEVSVTNNAEYTLTDLECYLVVYNRTTNTTLNMDEFGKNAFYSQKIPSLEPGESYDLTYSLSIMYVGDFRFNAIVLDNANQVSVTSNPLEVNMIANSKMNKTLVISTAVVMPLLLACGAFLIQKKKKYIAK